MAWCLRLPSGKHHVQKSSKNIKKLWNITIHHHFQWVNQRTKWPFSSIFHSELFVYQRLVTKCDFFQSDYIRFHQGDGARICRMLDGEMTKMASICGCWILTHPRVDPLVKCHLPRMRLRQFLDLFRSFPADISYRIPFSFLKRGTPEICGTVSPVRELSSQVSHGVASVKDGWWMLVIFRDFWGFCSGLQDTETVSSVPWPSSGNWLASGHPYDKSIGRSIWIWKWLPYGCQNLGYFSPFFFRQIHIDELYSHTYIYIYIHTHTYYSLLFATQCLGVQSGS